MKQIHYFDSHNNFATHVISEQQYINLQKLVQGLRTMPPPDVKFNMCTYAHSFDDPTCGSSGCAIGVGSLIIEPRIIGPKRYGGTGMESWCDFALRLFGMCDAFSIPGRWCFSSAWTYIDNTPKGAAARITWMLENGVPSNWQAQMDGTAPLSYLELT